MCGILFAYNSDDPTIFIKQLKKMKNRGSDDVNIIMGDKFIAGASQLRTSRNHIIQPLQHDNIVILYDGMHDNDYVHLITKYGPLRAAEYMRSPFSYVVFNTETTEYYIARCHYGSQPLYVQRPDNGTVQSMWVSSEMKCLRRPEGVRPGIIITKDEIFDFKELKHSEHDRLRFALTASCERHLHVDVPWAILLTRTAKSCAMASLVTDSELDHANWLPIHTYSIRMEKQTKHPFAVELYSDYEYIYNSQDVIESIRDVIYLIESYDVELVRASIPIYLICKQMKKMGIRVVLCSEHYRVIEAVGIQCRSPYIDSNVVKCLKETSVEKEFKEEVSTFDDCSLSDILIRHAGQVINNNNDNKEKILYESIFKELFGV